MSEYSNASYTQRIAGSVLAVMLAGTLSSAAEAVPPEEFPIVSADPSVKTPPVNQTPDASTGLWSLCELDTYALTGIKSPKCKTAVPEGHRGSDNQPGFCENSRPTFEFVYSFGGAIETDEYELADKIEILAHDKDPDRTATAESMAAAGIARNTPWSSITSEQAQILRNPCGDSFMTLEEGINFCGAHGMICDIDVHSRIQGDEADDFQRLVETAGCTECSFYGTANQQASGEDFCNIDSLLELEAVGLPTGLKATSADCAAYSTPDALAAQGVDYIAAIPPNAAEVAAYQAKGMDYVSIISPALQDYSHRQWRDYVIWGVNRIITDYPQYLAGYLRTPVGLPPEPALTNIPLAATIPAEIKVGRYSSGCRVTVANTGGSPVIFEARRKETVIGAQAVKALCVVRHGKRRTHWQASTADGAYVANGVVKGRAAAAQDYCRNLAGKQGNRKKAPNGTVFMTKYGPAKRGSQRTSCVVMPLTTDAVHTKN